jgi:hypothetical protein
MRRRIRNYILRAGISPVEIELSNRIHGSSFNWLVQSSIAILGPKARYHQFYMVYIAAQNCLSSKIRKGQHTESTVTQWILVPQGFLRYMPRLFQLHCFLDPLLCTMLHFSCCLPMIARVLRCEERDGQSHCMTGR